MKDHRTSFKILLFLIMAAAGLSSCALDYSVPHAENSGAPEFVFSNAVYTRIEGRKSIMQMNADLIEQYEKDSSMYGKNLSFSVFEKDGSLSVTGSCGLFSGNTDTGIYRFLNDVELHSYKHEMNLISQNVLWNNTTSQLITDSTETVSITQTGSTEISMEGTNFSASGFSSSFTFSGPTSGTIIINDTPEDPDESGEAHD